MTAKEVNMIRDMSSLYAGLLKEAQDYRVPVFRLARIEKMKGGNCRIIPLLLREIELRITKNMEEGERKREALASLNMRRSQFLELKEDGARRKGK
jgi:hypothetical protein